MEFLPTGSDVLDRTIGGGIPVGKIVNIIGDKSTGKCVKNTYVITRKGMQLIDDLAKYSNDNISKYKNIFALNKHEEVISDLFYKQKVNKTIKIKTRHGFKEEATLDHPIMILNQSCEFEMKKFSQLKKGDVCIISKETNMFNDKYVDISDLNSYKSNKYSSNVKNINSPSILNEKLAVLLGYFVADGNFGKNCLFFSNEKSWFKKELRKNAFDVFGIELSKRGDILSVKITDLFKNIFENPQKFTARYKYVPKSIMESPKDVQSYFLKSLIDCDGSYDKSRKKVGNLEYYTASEELSIQIQLMLLNFGILSSRKSKFNKKYNHSYYTLRINSKSLIKYAKEIGSNKYDFSEIIGLDVNNLKDKSDFDNIPYLLEKIKNDILNLKLKVKWSKNGETNLGLRFPSFKISGSKNMTYNLLKDFVKKFNKFNKYIDLSFYKEILWNDYHYDPIVEIKEINEETEVYDLHIPDKHLFWGNGFINHNTLIASEIIAQSIKKFGDRIVYKYDDVEAGFSFNTQEMYGFDLIPEDEEDKMSDSIEEFDCRFDEYLSNLVDDQILIYVLDSLDGLTCDAERERNQERREAMRKGKKFNKGTYGQDKSKFFSNFFREKKQQIKQKKAILIVISQIRDKIGVTFGRTWTRTGGRALDFYAAQIMVLAESEKYKMRNKPIGICSKVKAEKVKDGRPFQTCYIDILFDYGIDNVSSNIKYLYNLKTDIGKDKGKKTDEIKWDKQDYTIKSLIHHIESSDLEGELTQRVLTKWKEEEQAVSIEAMGRKSKSELLGLKNTDMQNIFKTIL